MKKNENMLSILSYVFLVFIVILLGICSHFHLINNQKMVMICSGLILIFFGIVFTLETKLKWLEAEKRSSK
jgi:cytochrome c biogenesis protein CcdA